MTKERRVELSAKGGRSAHRSGKAHRFTSEEAAEAGSKGGKTTSFNREHMAKIGRMGGIAVTSKPGRAQELGRLSLESRMTPEEVRRASIRKKLEERR